jgi:hypothetical protein
MRDSLIRFPTKRLRQILVDDQGMPSSPTLPYRPRDRRIGHARYNHLSAHLAAHTLADAESWRSILAEQSEAFGVFHKA